jgi:SAM-dependent methyltransferase
MIFSKEYASAYDFLYRDKNYEAECDFIEALWGKRMTGVKRVLDLGCGTGGHALLLAGRGYEIVGVDRSADMLQRARIKSEELQVAAKFIQGDITSIDFAESFDVSISMFAVMSYQTTNVALASACAVAYKHLKRDGLFIFDCWNGPAVLLEKPLPRFREIDIGGSERIVRFAEPLLDVASQTVEVRYTIFNISQGKLIHETREKHVVRFIFPQEIKYFLEVAGFSSVEFCPFLEPERPLMETDWNMTVIARK